MLFSSTIKQVLLSIANYATVYTIQGDTVGEMFIPSPRGRGETRISLHTMFSVIRSLSGLFHPKTLIEREMNVLKPPLPLINEIVRVEKFLPKHLLNIKLV